MSVTLHTAASRECRSLLLLLLLLRQPAVVVEFAEEERVEKAEAKKS